MLVHRLRLHSTLVEAFAGAVGEVAQMSILYPLDTIKVGKTGATGAGLCCGGGVWAPIKLAYCGWAVGPQLSPLPCAAAAGGMDTCGFFGGGAGGTIAFWHLERGMHACMMPYRGRGADHGEHGAWLSLLPCRRAYVAGYG